MKAFLFLVAAAVCLTGCDNSQTSSAAKTNESTSPLTAPGDYLGALNKGKVSAEKTADTASLNKAIQMFSVENGRNPKSLDELVQEKYIPALPKAPYGMELRYDQASGKVTVAPKPQ